MAGRSLSWVYEFWRSHDGAADSTAATGRPTRVLDRIRAARIGRRDARGRRGTREHPARRSAGRVSRLADTSRAVSTKFDVAAEDEPGHPQQRLAVASRRRGQAGIAMRRITSRFVLLIATAAVLPLVIYGYVSINSLRSGTRTSVREGNVKVAKQVAEQVSMYMRHNTRVLQSVGAELGATELTPVAAGPHPQGLRPRSSRSSARSPSSISAGAATRDERHRRRPADGSGAGAAPAGEAATSRR